jgi:hypothetical protein
MWDYYLIIKINILRTLLQGFENRGADEIFGVQRGEVRGG